MERKLVTDLSPWFTEDIKMKNIVTGAWLISDKEKKRIVIKFNEEIPSMERIVYLRCITESLMKRAAMEDVKGGGKSELGSIMDMMYIREWHKEDEETIRNGIPHDIV